MSEEKIIIDANDGSQNTNDKFLDDVKQELQEFKKEIEFATSTLSGKAEETGSILNQSLTNFEQNNTRLETALKNHEERNKDFEKKISILTLLPEKLSNRIKDTVPDIAEALNVKIKQNMDITRQQFDSLNQEMILRVQDQQEKISQLTTRLIQESSVAVGNSWRGFFIKLLITIVLAIGVSAMTSYLVTVKYPRFIEITGAHDVKVQDSEVKIWGQVKDPKKEEAKK